MFTDPHTPAARYTLRGHVLNHPEGVEEPAVCTFCHTNAAARERLKAEAEWEATRAEAAASSAGAGLALVLAFAVVVIVTGFALVVTRPLPWDGAHLADFLIAGAGVSLAWRALSVAGRGLR